MRPLHPRRWAVLLKSLMKGDSIKKAAAGIGSGNERVRQSLLEIGTACRYHHNRLIRELTVEEVLCQRIWGFSYVRRRNAYMPEANHALPEDGWVWVATHEPSGLVVDWLVGTGDTRTARRFVTKVSDRLCAPVQLSTRGRELVLARDGGQDDFTAVLARLYDNPPPAAPPGISEAAVRAAQADGADFDRRCQNLHLALSVHFSRHNLLAEEGGTPPAQAIGIIPQPLTLDQLVEPPPE